MQPVQLAQTGQTGPGLRALRAAAALLFTVAAGAQAPPDRGPPTSLPVLPVLPVLPAVPAESAPAAVTASDGRHLLRAQGGQLQMQDNAGHILRTWPLRGLQGHAGTVLAMFDAPPRHSFVLVLRDLAELWEISYDPAAEPIFDGWVHDYRMGEGLAQPGYLGIRRTRLARPLVAVFFDSRMPWLVGAEPGEPVGSPPVLPLAAVVLHLDIRRAVARFALPDQPLPDQSSPAQPSPTQFQSGPALQPLGGTRLWHEDGRWLLRLPATAGWAVYDSQRWVLLRHEPR